MKRILFVLACLLHATPALAACPYPINPTIPPSFIGADCTITWPDKSGFAGEPVSVTLGAGAIIDRFVQKEKADNDTGNFFSTTGTSYSKRAMPYICNGLSYSVYRVKKPLKVLGGISAPWFGSPGGAIQYQTDRNENVSHLVLTGTIERVGWPMEAPCDK
jgi:hypothetical protein